MGKPFAADAKAVLGMRARGMTLSAIAKELGCSLSAVHNAARRGGEVQRRRRLDAKEAVRLVSAGMAPIDVARKYGVTRQAVSLVVLAAGLRLRSRNVESDELVTIKALWDGGLTAPDIAERTRFSAPMVRAHLKRLGVWELRPRRPRKPKCDPQEAVRLRRDEGLTVERVAERLGVSSQTVVRLCLQAGFRQRPPKVRGAPVDHGEVMRLLGEGVHYREVAERVGCSPAHVCWIRKRRS